MSLIRFNRNPTPTFLRQFAGTFVIGLGIIGGLVLHSSGSWRVAITLWVVGLLIGTFGLLFPRGMRPLYFGVSYITFPIGFVVSYVLLTTIFYAVITPIGLLTRVVGYDPMRKRFDAAKPSYWTPRGEPEDVDAYLRQY